MWTLPNLVILLSLYITYASSFPDETEIAEIKDALAAEGVTAEPPSCLYAASDCPYVDQVCIRKICYRVCSSDDDCIPSFECVSDNGYAGDVCKPRKTRGSKAAGGTSTATGAKAGGKARKRKSKKAASSATTMPPNKELIFADSNISETGSNKAINNSSLAVIIFMIIGTMIILYAYYYKRHYFCKNADKEELQSISQNVSNYESV